MSTVCFNAEYLVVSHLSQISVWTPQRYVFVYWCATYAANKLLHLPHHIARLSSIRSRWRRVCTWPQPDCCALSLFATPSSTTPASPCLSSPTRPSGKSAKAARRLGRRFKETSRYHSTFASTTWRPELVYALFRTERYFCCVYNSEIFLLQRQVCSFPECIDVFFGIFQGYFWDSLTSDPKRFLSSSNVRKCLSPHLPSLPFNLFTSLISLLHTISLFFLHLCMLN